ncbi:MAG: type IV secretion system protein VirB10 [Gammaproteobacteria bacterium]|nr:type IV secretion system protein VirB10 [Gammaproteobacteria bacterium]
MSLLDRFRQAPAEPPPDSAAGEAGVEGERAASAVQRPPSLQSRVSNLLAFGLMAAIGLGLLGWYYGKVMTSRTASRTAAESSAKSKAEGEINLRPLGRVDPPALAQRVLGDAPEEPPPEDIPEAWLRPAEDPPATRTPGYAPPVKEPRDLRLERQLSGRAFVTSADRTAAAVGSEAVGSVGGEGAGPVGDLDALLRPSVTPAVQAQVLPTRRMLLPKGAFLDCTLETALDSTLPGMTTCILATDAFSADGSVVLLERGTKLVGETRGQVRQGAARVYVLWTEARTSQGVVVPLASPGTDELGRAGLPGRVDRHFMERFGAAILVSVIDGAIQAEVASQRGNGSTVVVDPSGSRDIMTEILRSTINIPPTVVKPQGDRIQVLVARDLDFRSVYELRPASR